MLRSYQREIHLFLVRLASIVRAQRLNIGIISGILILLLVIKWNVLSLPFFWDEMGAYVLYVFKAHKDFLKFFTAMEFLGHPPGLQFIVFIVHKLFGQSIFVTRMVCLLQTFLLVCVVYLAGKKLADWKVGLFAALNLFFFPIIFAQSTLFLGDINFTPFIFLYIYLFFWGKYRWAFGVGFLCGLLRETSLLFSFTLSVISIMRWRDLTRGKLASALAPLISFVCFMLSNLIQSGHLLTHPAVLEGHFIFSLSQFFATFVMCCRMIFVDQHLYIFLIPLMVGGICSGILALFFKEKSFISEYIFAVIFVSFVFVVFCTFNSGRLVRYFIPIIPGIVLLGTYFLWKFLGRISWAIQIIIFVFLIKHHIASSPVIQGTAFETEMQYVDVIKVSQMMTKYVEENYSDKIIFSPWPIFNMFRFPYMGYVSQKMKVEYPSERSSRLVPCGPFDIFVWSGNSDIKFVADKERFLQEYSLKLVKSFEQNGKVAEIYVKSDSDAKFQ